MDDKKLKSSDKIKSDNESMRVRTKCFISSEEISMSVIGVIDNWLS